MWAVEGIGGGGEVCVCACVWVGAFLAITKRRRRVVGVGITPYILFSFILAVTFWYAT